MGSRLRRRSKSREVDRDIDCGKRCRHHEVKMVNGTNLTSAHGVRLISWFSRIGDRRAAADGLTGERVENHYRRDGRERGPSSLAAPRRS